MVPEFWKIFTYFDEKNLRKEERRKKKSISQIPMFQTFVLNLKSFPEISITKLY